MMGRALLAFVLIVGCLQVHAAAPAHRGGVSLQQLIVGCTIDARRNPVTLFCPQDCVVEIANGATADSPPRITVAPACRALR